ncbi:MAG TPA: 4-(cytidine 5'-diphospho)-2-C-methyl-D-erythritol kinase [Gammaproteobacteria bacterium]|nr:4-(cytidine 5'-diphospho)-2-C-methyl-D-erythritol kinase [Gammaproteobacteria bacterium]
MTESWPAPAKLNRFLHVTGRRPDGYHSLQTVFQFLGMHDLLRFDITADGRIARAQPLAGVPDERDLSVRAARLLQQAAGGTTQGAIIHLDKHLPLGGGLGGGSSDAATTLLVLNRMWGLELDLDRLAELGLQLGADVPVFVRGHAAWGEGVGELLTPVELPEDWMVVLVPPVSVSTAEVFAQFDQEDHLTPASPPIRIRGFHAGQGRNDLEPVVRRLYPEVDKALTWLGKFGDARMTGSGACLFLPVESEARGRAVLAECPPPLASGFVARAMNRHPVHQRLYGN